jgi:hypothetical protein
MNSAAMQPQTATIVKTRNNRSGAAIVWELSTTMDNIPMVVIACDNAIQSRCALPDRSRSNIRPISSFFIVTHLDAGLFSEALLQA